MRRWDGIGKCDANGQRWISAFGVILALLSFYEIVDAQPAAESASDSTPPSQQQPSGSWSEARQLYLSEQFEASREQLEKIIAVGADRYDVWEAWIATYRPGSQLEKAASELDERLRDQGANSHLLFARGLAARYAGQLPAARSAFQRAAELDSASSAIPFQHSLCFRRNDANHTRLLDQALKIAPTDLTVLDHWIEIQIADRDRATEEIEKHYHELTDRDVTERLRHFIAASTITHQDDKEKKTYAWRVAVEHLEILLQRETKDAQLWSLLANQYRSNNMDLALAAIDKGEQLRWWWTDWAYFRSNAIYYAQGAKESLELSRRYTRYFPDSSQAWANLAMDNFGIGKPEEVLDQFAKARACDVLNQSIMARLNLGVYYHMFLKKQYDQALHWYRETLEVDPKFLATRDVVQFIIQLLDHLSSDDANQLREWIIQKEESVQDDIWPTLMLARIDAALQKYKSSADAFVRAADQAPDQTDRVVKPFDTKLTQAQQDGVLEELRGLADERKSPNAYRFLGAVMNRLAFSRSDRQLFEDALVPYLKAYALLQNSTSSGTKEKQTVCREVGDLYATLGEFRPAYKFYQLAGEPAYQDATELFQQSSPDEVSTIKESEFDSLDWSSRFDLKQISGGDVNVVNAYNLNFFFGVTDLPIAELTRFQMPRFYNSRSLRNERFGFGWSSDFDIYIAFDPSDGGQFLVRGRSNFAFPLDDPEIREAFVEEILKRRRNRGLPVNDTIKQGIVDDSHYLAEKAKEVGMLDGTDNLLWLKKLDRTWSDAHNNRLFVRDDYLVFVESTEEMTCRFLQNRPNQVTHPNGGVVDLQYDDGQLVRANAKNRFVQFFHTDGKVSRIRDHRGREVRYIYDRDGACLASRSSDGEVWGFLYNPWKNLTAIRFPNGNIQRIQYDDKKDSVAQVSPQSTGTQFEFTAQEFQPNLDTPARVSALQKHGWRTVLDGSIRMHTELLDNIPLEIIDREDFSLSRDLDTRSFYNLRDQNRRAIIEYDRFGRPKFLLNPDGSRVQYFFVGEERLVKGVLSGDGHFRFRFTDENNGSRQLVEGVDAPNDFSVKIDWNNNDLPTRITAKNGPSK